MLTSLSRTSVNVQVFPGTHTSGIQYYHSHNSIAGSECRFPANAILKDCTDEGCQAGTRNSFYVRGRYSGSWGNEREGEATPLRANRKLRFNQTRLFLLISFAVPLLVFIFTATDTIQESERTAKSITIAFTPIPGATGYEIVARSAYAGAFLGSCDVASTKCTVNGLVPALAYEIWLRTCTQTSAAIRNCDLRAQPISLTTRPGCEFFNSSFIL